MAPGYDFRKDPRSPKMRVNADGVTRLVKHREPKAKTPVAPAILKKGRTANAVVSRIKNG